MNVTGGMAVVVTITLTLLSAALALAFVRLARGPSLPDRVVAMDLIVAVLVGIAATYTVATGRAVSLDVALVLALIAFLSTVAVARYIEKGISR